MVDFEVEWGFHEEGGDWIGNVERLNYTRCLYTTSDYLLLIFIYFIYTHPTPIDRPTDQQAKQSHLTLTV